MVDLLVTYMEMTAPPSGDAFAAPAPGAMVAHETLDIAGYVSLYRAVGEPVQWDQRLRIGSGELERLLALASTHIHVLRVDGEAAGLCEFNGVGQADVELAHFGLIPDFRAANSVRSCSTDRFAPSGRIGPEGSGCTPTPSTTPARNLSTRVQGSGPFCSAWRHFRIRNP